MGLRCGDTPEDILPAAEGKRMQTEQELDVAKARQREATLAFGEEVFQAAQDDTDLANRFSDRYAAVLQACSEAKELQCKLDTIEAETHDGIDASNNVCTAEEESQPVVDTEQATGLQAGAGVEPVFDLQPTVAFVPISDEQPTVAFVPVPGDQPTAVLQPVPATLSCPACGAPADIGDRYCMMCGTLLASAQPNAVAKADQAGRICPNCGAGYEKGDHFCMMCGQKLL